MDKPHKFLKEWFEDKKANEQARVVQVRKLLKLDDPADVKQDILLPRTKIKLADFQRARQALKAAQGVPLQFPDVQWFAPWKIEQELRDATIEGKSIFANARKFVAALQKKGFTRIGSGAYGTVLMHPKGDKVLKVVHRPEFDGWPHYVKWAKDAGYAGTFAPKVFAYKNIGSFAIASMEKLDATISDAGHKSDVYAKYSLFENSHENNLMMMLMDLAEPGLAKFSEDFHAKFKYANDMHQGNAMSRKGQLVITDPLSSWREPRVPNWKLVDEAVTKLAA